MAKPRNFNSSQPIAATWLGLAFFIAAIIVAQSPVLGGWYNAKWAYRRPITVAWNPDKASGDELAMFEFYSNGHAMPNGEDIRVATEEGQLLSSRVLMSVGDLHRVVFALEKGQKNYHVYFGNPAPAPPPRGFEDVNYRSGLCIDVKVWTGGGLDSINQFEKSWERSQPRIGATLIDRPFIGYNPVGDQQQTISRLTGSLFAPIDGEYLIAIAVDDDAALLIDGKPVLIAHLGGGDIRYHKEIHLLRGRHDFLLYWVNAASEQRLSVGWKRPDTGAVEIIGREAFGVFFRGTAGGLEQKDKSFVADAAVDLLGECYVQDNCLFRYHFTGRGHGSGTIKYDWDFGDGQTSTDAETDHIYLSDGVYPVRVTAHLGPNSTSETIHVAVNRNWERQLNPQTDDAQKVSKMVAGYDLTSVPLSWLPRAVNLHLKAAQFDTALKAAGELAGRKSHPDANLAAVSLMSAEKAAIDHGQVSTAVDMWRRAPENSDIQPRATKRAAHLSLWWMADFNQTIQILDSMRQRGDDSIRRPYAQALLLAGKVDEAKKAMADLKPQGPLDRKAVLSGASARSVEYYITEADAEAGEDAWDRWMARYPDEFLQGYSVLLRTKLMQLRKCDAAAARVAEAFANAMPQATYSPNLLDQASKLLATSDPARSQLLRQMLKQKYPENPLSQN